VHVAAVVVPEALRGVAADSLKKLACTSQQVDIVNMNCQLSNCLGRLPGLAK
jgi:hypothetical protein